MVYHRSTFYIYANDAKKRATLIPGVFREGLKGFQGRKMEQLYENLGNSLRSAKNRRNLYVAREEFWQAQSPIQHHAKLKVGEGSWKPFT